MNKSEKEELEYMDRSTFNGNVANYVITYSLYQYHALLL